MLNLRKGTLTKKTMSKMKRFKSSLIMVTAKPKFVLFPIIKIDPKLPHTAPPKNDQFSSILGRIKHLKMNLIMRTLKNTRQKAVKSKQILTLTCLSQSIRVPFLINYQAFVNQYQSRMKKHCTMSHKTNQIGW